MIIAISTRVTEAQNYSEKRNSISFDFVAYLEELGIVPLLIPNNLSDVNSYLSAFKVEGIILTGGNNVDPKKYNSLSLLPDVYPERDETETLLFKYAINKKIPILGVCRGFHFINIQLGGSLTNNINNHVNVKHKLLSLDFDYNHKVVNSYHNQGIKEIQLSSKLNCLALSEDKLIEAYRNTESKILGFQWHPERNHSDFDSKLIKNHFSIK
jgi:gamma-glutamyl-gamma-aminobutyrate hydrolase PuuD|tara:strand:- start:112 stop:747 length:636 start_codon:yes stop_codon:yes gene_type:complete